MGSKPGILKVDSKPGDERGRISLVETTVKTHVGNILQKLNLADRTQAALYAVRERIVDL